MTLVSTKSGVEKGMDTELNEYEATLGQIQSIEEALREASKHFECSITQIEYEIVQNNTNGFLGLFKKEQTQEPARESFSRRQLLEDLYLTKNALDTAYANFEAVVDPDLIDCYTYEIYSVQKRYKFLLEQARQMDLQTFF